jgi:hypothetical protein
MKMGTNALGTAERGPGAQNKKMGADVLGTAENIRTGPGALGTAKKESGRTKS